LLRSDKQEVEYDKDQDEWQQAYQSAGGVASLKERQRTEMVCYVH
jgi:hypothetical protein